jgi:UDP-N-acetylglucosamine 2-epimerase (non-hydrolysing)
MQPGQDLPELASRAMHALGHYLGNSKSDLVLVQGDTTTAFCGALAAVYRHIPVGHVEAGLRTYNLNSPWPEEANRRLISSVSSLHFAPTTWSEGNLLREGVTPESIYVTGNTVIDALLSVRDRIRATPPRIQSLPEWMNLGRSDDKRRRVVLVTGHRRENFGIGFESICKAVASLAECYPEVDFVYPVHLNPSVREPVGRILGSSSGTITLRNIHLIEPLDYEAFVALMDYSDIVLSDSGGIQEEAPSLGKPVLVMRDTTERPEAVSAGTAKLVGTDCATIIAGVSELLDNPAAYRLMATATNPYGDGKASLRVLEAIDSYFSKP